MTTTGLRQRVRSTLILLAPILEPVAFATAVGVAAGSPAVGAIAGGGATVALLLWRDRVRPSRAPAGRGEAER